MPDSPSRIWSMRMRLGSGLGTTVAMTVDRGRVRVGLRMAAMQAEEGVWDISKPSDLLISSVAASPRRLFILRRAGGGLSA